MKTLPLQIDNVFSLLLKQRKRCGIEMQRTHLSCGKVTQNEANEADLTFCGNGQRFMQLASPSFLRVRGHANDNLRAQTTSFLFSF